MQEAQSLDSVLDTQQKKLSFYQNLILVAVADGVLEEEESSFLLLIGNKLGLSKDDVMPIAENLPFLNFIIPQEGMQKTLELQTLVQLMLQDGHMHDREYILCLDYARRIGYTKDILDDMVKQFTADNTKS
jgi:hypothetical protein